MPLHCGITFVTIIYKNNAKTTNVLYYNIKIYLPQPPHFHLSGAVIIFSSANCNSKRNLSIYLFLYISCPNKKNANKNPLYIVALLLEPSFRKKWF